MFICAVLLSGLLGGCTSDQGATSSDCASVIRREGVVYVEAGFTKHPATASGQAERAECHDVGRDAPGPVFPADAKHVHVVAFESHARSDVLGVREDRRIRVFVAEGVAAEPVMNALSGDRDK